MKQAAARTAVVVINYKRAADTAICVQSLLRCVPLPPLVVVDNTPNDPELDAAIAAYPRVHRLNSPANLGFSRGNNLGIKWALRETRCEFILILNNDAAVDPDTIAELERVMDARSEVGILSPRIVFADEPDRLWYGGGQISWMRGSAVVPGIFGPADAPLALTSRSVSFVSGCAMLVRRSVMEQIGGLDPRFFMYEEDLEFCLRAAEAGWKLHYQATALVRHRGQGSSREDGEPFVSRWSPKNPQLPFLARNSVQNTLLNMHEHATGASKWAFFITYPVYLAKKSLVLLINGRFDGLDAIWQGLRGYYRARRTGFRDELRDDATEAPEQ